MRMRILQVNRDDVGGGAAQMSCQLHRAYWQRGHDAWLAVANRKSQAAGIQQIVDDSYRTRWAAVWQQASTVLAPFARHSRQIECIRNLLAYIGQPARLWANL
jgi:hypothetical protein